MDANIGFNDDGCKVRLEIENNDFLNFMYDLELANRVTGKAMSEVEKFLLNLKNGEYEELNDVAREKLIEDKEIELKTINRAIDNINKVLILGNEI